MQPDNLSLAHITIRLLTDVEEIERWNSLMRKLHYLGSSDMVGEQLRYVAEHCGQWVALLGWSAATLKLSDRDNWLSWTLIQQRQRLHLVAQNARFLVLPEYEQPNVASRCLGLNLKVLSQDWMKRYNHPILLAETFVEAERNAGTCYRATGWKEIGETKGFRRTQSGYRRHGIVKRIFVKEVKPHARKTLSGRKGYDYDRPLESIELTAQPIEGAGSKGCPGLFDLISSTVTDPRQRRGRSYRMECLVAVILTGLLAGNTHCAAIAEWAKNLKSHERKRLRCPYRNGEYRAPTANTLRYFLQDLDHQEFEEAVRLWISCCGLNTDHTHIAIDGKVLCGSGLKREDSQSQLSAYSIDHEAVVHQKGITDKHSEISAARSLLDEMDITDAIISADAAHTNHQTAAKIVKKKGSMFSHLRETSLTFTRPPRAYLSSKPPEGQTTLPIAEDMDETKSERFMP